MTSILSIARYTFLQQFRNRLYLVVLLFGLLMMAAGLLLGALAPDQEVRVILDLGLATAEMFALATALFGAVALVLEEIDAKTIYLVLTRPVARPVYLVGRFAGLTVAVWASVAIMEALHLVLLALKGWEADPAVLLAIVMIGVKVMVMTALGLLCSLTFTSAPTAAVFTVFFWALGHFGQEIKYLAEKTGPAATAVANVVVAILPNLSILNVRDLLDVPGFAVGPFFMSAGYALLYAGACLALSAGLFSRREF